jgi:hypothetical protein
MPYFGEIAIGNGPNFGEIVELLLILILLLLYLLHDNSRP